MCRSSRWRHREFSFSDEVTCYHSTMVCATQPWLPFRIDCNKRQYVSKTKDLHWHSLHVRLKIEGGKFTQDFHYYLQLTWEPHVLTYMKCFSIFSICADGSGVVSRPPDANPSLLLLPSSGNTLQQQHLIGLCLYLHELMFYSD